jgi:tetratricopeptide (TPR) repeat protein
MIENLQSEIAALLDQENPPVVELRKALLEVEEFIASAEFQDLSAEQRNQAQDLRRDLKNRLRQIEESDASQAEAASGQPPAAGIEGSAAEAMRAAARPRDPLADQQMEDAEKLFYSGRYAEAIKLFDRVLQLEPGWERARQHRAESENYLRTGYIPPVALPAEAASAFGKAQSAARVGRYADALALLSRAQSVMRELGIQRWQEGLEFEQKLQENIDAENTYNEGMQFFEQGKIDEAIERVETAARATGLPKYTDRAQALRRVKEITRSINEALSSPNIEPKVVTQAKADLDLLTAEYGENPAIVRLRARLESVMPRAVAPLQEQARALKAQVERATTLDEAMYLARQARAQLDQIRNLAGLDEDLDHLQNEVDRLMRNVARYQDELAQATASYENNRSWPAQADRISLEVRQHYPNDPGVVRLNRSLARYHFLRGAIKVGGAVLLLLALLGAGYFAYGRFQSYLLSLTPTATATFTPTPTVTPSLTPTPTATLTPTATHTPLPTPTPIAGVTLREVWARSGCYEGFNAISRIPQGGLLRFLPSERRFDQFNRECVLVEYQGPDKSVIGWVLIMDVDSSTVTPTP